MKDRRESSAKSSTDGRRRGVERSAEVRRRAAIDAYADVAGDIRRWRGEGLSYRAIASGLAREKLEARGLSATKVWRVLDRLGQSG